MGKLPPVHKLNQYFSFDRLKQEKVKKLSPAMSEYLKLKTFDAKVEKKKHNYLKNYFYERYKHVSHMLSEDQLAQMK